MARSTMQLEDWLDDLCVRFIINLPEEDLSSVARICFQVEEAQWFYEDFIRPLDPALPSMSLRTFCLRIFQHCPLLAHFSVENHTKAFEEFLEYKTRIPVRGAIMLNHDMDSAVLVKGWKKGANWGFPGGKINKDEDDLDCAIREVYEETGLDLRGAGLVPTEGQPKYIELPIKNHAVRLYVFRDVPMDTNFEPQTRKEISKIQWYNLSELPTFRRKGGQHDAPPATGANKFYMVAPFMVPLKKWVLSQKKIQEKRVVSGQYLRPTLITEETVTEDDTPAPYDPIPVKEPSINTLDGATRELQRLLKMQPPTEGAQLPPPNLEDKGSALLSILQSKGTGPAIAPQASFQYPHTPQDHPGAIPQPRNPHHHNNQHADPLPTQQPPPPFPLPPNHGAQQWNGAQLQFQGQQFAKGYQALNQQQYGNNHAALVHPQPLPPQVQRAIFNKSTFQDGPSPQPQAPAQNPQIAPQYNHAQQAQVPQQLRVDPAQAKPVLNGRSIELLGAFKRTADPALSAQPPAPNGSAAPASGVGHGQPSIYAQQAAPNFPGPLNGFARPAALENPPAAPVAGQSDQHRSALLGMFKTAPSDNAPPQQYPNGQASIGNQAGRGLLAQLQGQPRAGNGQPVLPGQPAPANPGAGPQLSLANLFIQPRPAESRNPPPGQVPAAAPSSASNSKQPIRILQRGQTLQPANTDDQPPTGAKHTPYGGQQQQPSPTAAASPPVSTSNPSPGLQNRRPAGPADQKRQLLSLFGKQQGAAGGGEPASHRGSTGSADAPRSRLSSMASGSEERRGSQTPISPADQSFLLGYLQSVTNSASR